MHFPAVEEDDRTGLALPGSFLWQSFKWASQFIFGILQYMSRLEVLACNIDTALNYYKISLKNIFNSIKIEHNISISRPFCRYIIKKIFFGGMGGTLTPEPPLGLCSGPAGGITAPPSCVCCVLCALGMHYVHPMFTSQTLKHQPKTFCTTP